MSELGQGGGDGFEDQRVLEGVGEVVLAANDVADAQVGVIGAGGHVVSRHGVGAEQGEVLDIGGGLGLWAVDGVVEADDSFRLARHAKAQGEGLVTGGAAVALFF